MEKLKTIAERERENTLTTKKMDNASLFPQTPVAKDMTLGSFHFYRPYPNTILISHKKSPQSVEIGTHHDYLHDEA